MCDGSNEEAHVLISIKILQICDVGSSQQLKRAYEQPSQILKSPGAEPEVDRWSFARKFRKFQKKKILEERLDKRHVSSNV